MIFSPERRLRVLESRNSAQSSFISGRGFLLLKSLNPFFQGSSELGESRYTGGLFGLGCDSKGESVYKGKFAF